MSKRILVGVLAGAVLLALPVVGSADAGHGKKMESAPRAGGHGDHDGHGMSTPANSGVRGAWSALMAARDGISADLEAGALNDIHAKSGPLPELVAGLLAQSGDLETSKRTRVEGAAKQVSRVADALHVAADRGDAERTRKELERLDGLLQLIRAQYEDGALDGGMSGHEGHSAAPSNDHGAHAHMDRPVGVVDAASQATLRVEVLDPFRFQPERLELRAGVPTRIEVVNVGVVEHSLVVKTPDGAQDWVHLHVAPGVTEAATYQLDEPGTYPVVCSVPGHTEGGMIGELIVLASQDGEHSRH